MWNRYVTGLAAAAVLCLVTAGDAEALRLNVGDTAPMFQTIDETFQPVDMADLIHKRPLVMIVGSAS